MVHFFVFCAWRWKDNFSDSFFFSPGKKNCVVFCFDPIHLRCSFFSQLDQITLNVFRGASAESACEIYEC